MGVRGGVVAPGSHLQGGAALWPGWVIFQRCANYNFPSTRSTRMDSCSFAWCGSLIITSQSTSWHVCLFLQIHSILVSVKCMISFFSLYFFIYCASCFEVDFSSCRFLFTSGEVNFPQSRRLKSTWRHSKSESREARAATAVTTFRCGPHPRRPRPGLRVTTTSDSTTQTSYAKKVYRLRSLYHCDTTCHDVSTSRLPELNSYWHALGSTCVYAKSLVLLSPTQSSIPPGSVNEYQLRLGRQRQVWFIPLANERGVCR